MSVTPPTIQAFASSARAVLVSCGAMQPARHSMRTRVGAVMLAGLVVAALGACGTARIVAKTPVGGTIELEGDHNKAMEQANQEMAEHCGLSNFTVLSEGAEPV